MPAKRKAAEDKPLSLPELINKYNKARAMAHAAKAAMDECLAPLKDYAHRHGKKVTDNELRATAMIDGWACVVTLGLARSFEPNVVEVFGAAGGLQGCIEADLLSVRIEALRKFAATNQIPMDKLGSPGDPTERIGLCQAMPIPK